MKRIPQGQLHLWEAEKPVEPENFIECIHYDGSREILSTLHDGEELRKPDMTIWEAGFVTRRDYEEYKASLLKKV